MKKIEEINLEENPLVYVNLPSIEIANKIFYRAQNIKSIFINISEGNTL